MDHYPRLNPHQLSSPFGAHLISLFVPHHFTQGPRWLFNSLHLLYVFLFILSAGCQWTLHHGQPSRSEEGLGECKRMAGPRRKGTEVSSRS
jgi:hypothetical protein